MPSLRSARLRPAPPQRPRSVLARLGCLLASGALLVSACGDRPPLPVKQPGVPGDVALGGGGDFARAGDDQGALDDGGGPGPGDDHRPGDPHAGGDLLPAPGDPGAVAGDPAAPSGDPASGGDSNLPVICTSPYAEPGSALAITPPVTRQDVVCDWSSVYYRLSVAGPTRLQAELSWANAGDDLDLRLFDSGVQVLEQSCLGHGAREALGRTLMAGAYYLEVRGTDVWAYSGAPYTLSLSAAPLCLQDADCASPDFCRLRYQLASWEDLTYDLVGGCASYQTPGGDAFGVEDGGGPASDSYHQASAFSIAAGTWYHGCKIAPEDVDVFRYEATAVGRLQVEVSTSGIDLDLRLYNAANGSLGYALGPGTSSETLVYSYGSTGTYYLYVSDFGWPELAGAAPQSGGYSLRLLHETSQRCNVFSCTAAAAPGRPTCLEAGTDSGACVP